MASDFAAQAAELPTSYTFDSVAATGSFTDLRQEKGMQMDGYLGQEEGRLTILLADHVTPPVENDPRLITIASVTYRVSVREDSPNGVEATLSLRKSN